jgi:hypothetical protein
VTIIESAMREGRRRPGCGGGDVTLAAWIRGSFHFLHFVTFAAAAASRERGFEGDGGGSGEGDIEGDRRACRRLRVSEREQ